jgi:hypothetical protein
MEFDLPKGDSSIIKVVGVGGGGEACVTGGIILVVVILAFAVAGAANVAVAGWRTISVD